MKSNHTPGPWEIAQYNEPGYLLIHDKYGVGIAEACEQEGESEQEANARLIVAAPELLDALKELVYVTGFTYKDAPSLKKAKAAIAKATGEKEEAI